MEISNNCDYIIPHLFSYDFRSCSYNILKSIGWDLSGIDYNNKEKRNIQIGLLQRENPFLTRFILNSINNLIDHYMTINNVNSKDIIVRARDGFISKVRLTVIDDTMPIELRNTISKIIISYDRSKYLALHTNGNVEVKGIRNKVLDLSFYKMFRNLNFSTKKGLLIGLERMRQTVLKSTNILWFVREDEPGSYMIPIIGTGLLKLNKSSLHLVDCDEVDKNFVWDEYMWPFARSILIHCHAN